jgi:hypothetical protein
MDRITNKDIMEKLEILQHDTSHQELRQKMDALSNAVNVLQRNAADKETMRETFP